MSHTEVSCSKRSQSVLSEDDDVPKGNSREYFSDRGSLRKKPIRKSKFLSRKQVMFKYMERVERINKKLRDMQKMKLKREILNQQRCQPMNVMSVLQNINNLNSGMDNDLNCAEDNLRSLIMKIHQKTQKVQDFC